MRAAFLRCLAPVVVALLAGAPGLAEAKTSPAALLKLLPDDTSMLAVADVAASRGSPLMPAISAEVLGRSPQLMDVLRPTVPDPVAAIDLYVAAKTGAPSNTLDHVIFLCEGRFPADLLAKTAYSAMVVDRGITVYTIGATEAAMLGARLAVTAAGDMTRLIDLSKGSGPTVSAARSKQAATLRAAIAGTDTTRHGWAVSRTDGTIAPMLALVGMTPRWISFTTQLTADLGIEARFGLATAADAAAMVVQADAAKAGMQSQAGMVGLGGVVAATSFSSAKAVFRVRSSLSASDLSTFVSVLRMVIP